MVLQEIIPPDDDPDLIACKGIDGTEGYCYKSDLLGTLKKPGRSAKSYGVAG